MDANSQILHTVCNQDKFIVVKNYQHRNEVVHYGFMNEMSLWHIPNSTGVWKPKGYKKLSNTIRKS